MSLFMLNAHNPQAGFINGVPIVLNSDQVKSFATNLQSVEFITQSLYDSATYPAAGIAALTFFQSAIGGGVSPLNGAAKTLEDTNMLTAGFLPNGQAYLLTAIELDIETGFGVSGSLNPTAARPSVYGAGAASTQVNDMWLLREMGSLTLNISSKPYMQEGPLMRFPPSNDFDVGAGASDTTSPGSNQQYRTAFGKAIGPNYQLAPNNLLLISMMNFSVVLNWAVPPVLTTAARIFARFTGQLMRVAQ